MLAARSRKTWRLEHAARALASYDRSLPSALPRRESASGLTLATHLS
jgi:hypothetical protein